MVSLLLSGSEILALSYHASERTSRSLSISIIVILISLLISNISDNSKFPTISEAGPDIGLTLQTIFYLMFGLTLQTLFSLA